MSFLVTGGRSVVRREEVVVFNEACIGLILLNKGEESVGIGLSLVTGRSKVSEIGKEKYCKILGSFDL